MNTLHTVNKSGQPLELCLRSADEQDAILLIEDGTYCLLNQSEPLSACRVYVLEADANARGIVCPDNASGINYAQFVELTANYSKTLSWF